METKICAENYCGSCKKTFCNPQGLKRHLKTAKYCIEKRGEIQIPFYVCKWCNQPFNQNWYLTKHLELCQEKKIETKKIVELETQIKQLKELIEEKDAIIIDQKLKLAHNSGKVEVLEKFKPPKIVNNNNNGSGGFYVSPKILNLPTSNIRPLTRELIQEHIDEFYDVSTYMEGYQGLFNFIKDIVYNNENDYYGPKERNLVCSDKGRDTFCKLDFDKIENIKKWVSDGMALSIDEILTMLERPTTNCCGLVNNKNLNDAAKELSFETLSGITGSNTADRLILSKRLRTDLKQYLVV
jgi:hypothetical protein